jgi:hypothetical protein
VLGDTEEARGTRNIDENWGELLFPSKEHRYAFGHGVGKGAWINPSEGAKALTVNVPVEILNRAKTRASLEGTSMSVIVSDALTAYADGLKDVLARLGLAQ